MAGKEGRNMHLPVQQHVFLVPPEPLQQTACYLWPKKMRIHFTLSMSKYKNENKPYINIANKFFIKLQCKTNSVQTCVYSSKQPQGLLQLLWQLPLPLRFQQRIKGPKGGWSELSTWLESLHKQRNKINKPYDIDAIRPINT